MTGLELRLFAAQIYKLFPELVTVVRVSAQAGPDWCRLGSLVQRFKKPEDSVWAHLTVVPNRLVKAPLAEVRRRHIRHQTRRFRRVW